VVGSAGGSSIGGVPQAPLHIDGFAIHEGTMVFNNVRGNNNVLIHGDAGSADQRDNVFVFNASLSSMGMGLGAPLAIFYVLDDNPLRSASMIVDRGNLASPRLLVKTDTGAGFPELGFRIPNTGLTPPALR